MHHRELRVAVLAIVLAAACSCERTSEPTAQDAALGPPEDGATPLAPTGQPAPINSGPSPIARETLTLLAGGDVSLGRMIGQILLREPERDLFATIKPLLGTAEVRFVNLESQLSDQKGE